ncbi:hypothetical protein BC828DRAFT_403799 [Blastocladiella britannica]|nr:hypothetical protein BC828DRAFT_403799 [Blastocladiella britannica]
MSRVPPHLEQQTKCQDCTALMSMAAAIHYDDDPFRDAHLPPPPEPQCGCCTWPGVGCDSEGRITRVQWDDMELAGVLAESDLTSLQWLGVLSLAGNPGIRGPFPVAAIGSLAKLTALNLASTSMTLADDDATLVRIGPLVTQCTLPPTIHGLPPPCTNSPNSILQQEDAPNPLPWDWTPQTIAILAASGVVALSIIVIAVAWACWQANKAEHFERRVALLADMHGAVEVPFNSPLAEAAAAADQVARLSLPRPPHESMTRRPSVSTVVQTDWTAMDRTVVIARRQSMFPVLLSPNNRSGPMLPPPRARSVVVHGGRVRWSRSSAATSGSEATLMPTDPP